jgi:hypothetical protein
VKRTSTAIGVSMVLALGLPACGGNDDQGALDGVDAVVFLQRPRRNEMGDIFQYTSYLPGAKLVKLSPPTNDGTLTTLCCDAAGPDYANIDINSYDLSFDAREIVFAGKLSSDQTYGLFVLTLDDGKVEQLSTDPSRDYIYPIFLPGNKIMFMTNNVVEEGAPQHRDEYERGVTSQVGIMNRDGSGQVLGPRNLSHRVFPTLMSDGRVLFTQWDHLGDENSGHLMIMLPDMTGLLEAFGKEGNGVSNSYLKAREISDGRFVAIGTSRDRTIQSGGILDIRLGKAYEDGDDLKADREMSEANSSYRLLTPLVPLDNEPAPITIGRYYDAYPLDARDTPTMLVSWSGGPVESETLGAAEMTADFGVYLLDRNGDRRPIWNDEATWDVGPRPLVARDAPPEISSSGNNEFSDDALLIGSLDVYDSSLDTFAPGSIYGVRVIEGFSAEEGIPDDFGLTEHEGAAMLGISKVQSDGSWAALVPANVPVHVQPIDIFGMSLRNEPVWFSGPSGGTAFCGGCHNDRARTTVIDPGLTDAVAIGPENLLGDVARADRLSADFSRDSVVGVPWDQALQPIFTQSCVDGCHDGTPGDANPSYTITEPESGLEFEWTFNLSAEPVDVAIGDLMLTGYSASHMSLVGPMMAELEEAGLVIEGDFEIYVEPGSARDSSLMKILNPPQLYPAPDLTRRAFADIAPHVVEKLGRDLTADEYHLLVLMCDAGGQYYSRENAPGLAP